MRVQNDNLTGNRDDAAVSIETLPDYWVQGREEGRETPLQMEGVQIRVGSCGLQRKRTRINRLFIGSLLVPTREGKTTTGLDAYLPETPRAVNRYLSARPLPALMHGEALSHAMPTGSDKRCSIFPGRARIMSSSSLRNFA
jgi:hypothetical protein